MNSSAARWPFSPVAFVVRSAVLFLFWLVLTGGDAKDMAPGVLAALIAGWISLGLLPAGALAFSPLAAASLFVRFLWQSVVAGTWVAWCALHPRMPISPGIIEYSPRLDEGPARDAFLTWSSLLPGTLPSGPGGSGGIVVHCLDTRAPLQEQMASEERRFAGLLRVAA
jgi:multicomponent Na+:H+ antiporter subunit E